MQKVNLIQGQPLSSDLRSKIVLSLYKSASFLFPVGYGKRYLFLTFQYKPKFYDSKNTFAVFYNDSWFSTGNTVASSTGY